MSSLGRKFALRRGMTALCAGAWLACAAGNAQALDSSLTATGASEDLQDSLKTASAVMSAGDRGLDNVQELIAAAQADYQTLVQVLYDRGYFSPVIHIRVDGREAAYIDPLALPSRIDRIAIEVAPGPQFRFGTAEIAPLAENTAMPEAFAPGAPASTGAIRDATAAGVQGWRDAGYAKATIDSQRITANHAAARLDAQVRLRPGQKLRFGKLIVAGNSDVREEAVQRIAGLPTGETYSPETLQTVNTRLRRTGTFSTVTLHEAETANPDGTLDVTTTLEDMPKRRISFGVEMSSNAGLDLSMAWMHRNLFHGAERLRIESSIGNIGGSEDIEGRLGIRLDRPDRLGPDDSIFYTFDIEQLEREHYSVSRTSLGIGARRVFSPDLVGEVAVVGMYANADDAFGDGRDFEYLGLPITLEWDKRDNPVNARGGHLLRLETMPFFGLSGSKSGGRLMADARAYRSFGATGRLTLAGRLQLGSVVGPAQSEVSPDLLFFSGGAGTVRGQPYDSLGIDVGGKTAGGRSFLGASVELRGQITDKISAVGFLDYGAVDASSFIGSDTASHSGAGLGVRYDLGGFGPVRFDLAYPVGGDTGEGLQYYIGIGQAF
ncbi:autotransporter assembly complex protein TamA [Pseudodonghicola flavimaris]|uniref:BamA/TamA family outer membrane protein n=1 Tax=Pseudodonghicola flavimaris TaxID=3050036 RepID=A0ABT7F3H8_9RHOB|nr:BamA/TamA family outer membrane protein [Pseudodonghicola flavimaris]MDK3019164.1 BamA/TamA family outer membrane protein [Pseudodonghicola flavimaris]